MKKIYVILLFLLAGELASAQIFTADEAVRHVGDSIQVCGKIYGGRFFETSNGSPTLLNMGAAFPANPLSIMIPGNLRAKLDYAPESQLKDKDICVRGRITLFKDKPEIIIHDISQIEIQK